MTGHDGITDRHGRFWRDLRISVMDRCNFRCPYCMPEASFPQEYRFLSPRERLGFKEIIRVARMAVRLGVRKIRLTGGEPLLRPELPRLVAALAELEGIEDLALTTNGLLLARQVEALRAAGLHRVTVSLDALDPDIFARMSGGRGTVGAVLEGIEAACRAGFPGGVKLNTVVQRGVNERQVVALVNHFRHSGVVLRFIEYMDVGTRNGWSLDDVVPAREIKALLEECGPLEALPCTHPGEVARRYRYCDGSAEVGLVTSVTSPFCSGCSRARLSSDGHFYTCLFASEGVDLRSLLRESADDARLEAVLRHVWQERTDRYSEERASRRGGAADSPPVEMNYIGG